MSPKLLPTRHRFRTPDGKNRKVADAGAIELVIAGQAKARKTGTTSKMTQAVKAPMR
jgi:hypothetical protein